MKQENGDVLEVGGSSNPNPILNSCPICLGPFNQEAYLDHCFHKFCYQCIVRWSKVVSSCSSACQASSTVKCPLCKRENFSIIYDYDGSTFQQHFIDQNNNNTFFSKAHKYRLQCYYMKSGSLSATFNVGRYWMLCKYRQPNNWLKKWLMRELQALIQEEDVEVIMYHILGVIESFSKSHDRKCSTRSPELKQEEFKIMVANAARSFLTARTDRFVVEVELFLASGLTIEAYDEAYKRCSGWKKPEIISEVTEITTNEHEPIASYLNLSDDDSIDAGWGEDV